MLFRLALRNVLKTLPKRLVFGGFFSITVALLFVGNTVFENSDRGLSSTYVRSFTGQASVSAKSVEPFTIFGSDLPLVGEFLVLPVIADATGLRQLLKEKLPEASVLPQVSAAASLALGSYQQAVPVFGVEFQAYFRFFPSLTLVRGSLPDVSQPAILLTDVQAKAVESRLKRTLQIGDRFTLTFAANSSFVIREVRLAGIYHYPASDALLDRIVLTDPDTARALDGYLYGGSEKVQLDESTQNVLNGDLGNLFDNVTDTVGPTAELGSAANSVQALAVQPAAAPVRGTLEGAWNFMLVNSASFSSEELKRRIVNLGADRPVQVRGWRETAGGTAVIAWFLQWIFNLGLLFIAVVSCLVLINSLALTILERTRELGTMRALGASRGFIAGLIGWETILFVFGAGAFGVFLGVIACAGLTSAHLALNNVYFASLFGGRILALPVSWQGVAFHLVLGFGLGLAAIILPIQRALAINPVKAIARDQ